MTDIPGQEDGGAAAAAPSSEEEGGFSAAFAERSTDAKSDEGAPGGKQDEGAGEAGAGKPAPAANEAPGDKPGDSARSEEEPAKEPNGAAAAANPWDGLSEAQKAYFERLQTSERSQRGRVGALTKKLTKLGASASPTAVAAGTSQPSGEDQGDGAGKPAAGGAGGTAVDRLAGLEEKLNGAVKDYPEFGPLKEAIDAIKDEMAGLKATTSLIAADMDAKEVTAAYASLERAHPDYATLAEDQSFLGWLGNQPESVVGLANSWNPSEVSLVFTLFKAERQAAIAASTPPPPPPPPPAPGGTGGANEADAKRRRQLEASREVPSRGGGAASGVPDDFGAAFSARSQQVITTR